MNNSDPRMPELENNATCLRSSISKSIKLKSLHAPATVVITFSPESKHVFNRQLTPTLHGREEAELFKT